MQPPVRIGASTLALLIAALSAVAAFITEWQSTGSPSPWLGAITPAILALLSVLRTWQQNVLVAQQPPLDEADGVDELPAEPTDVSVPLRPEDR
jgi:hypothetical protein